MSDVQRTYDGRLHGRLSGSRRKRRRRGGFPFKRLMFLLVLILVGAGYWITRDTHPVHHLIPAGQKYSVVMRDILSHRAALADSAVWETLPPELGSGRIIEALSSELALPEWMLRNIIVDDCYLSGNDLRQFDDVLCVAKMTHIGRLVEQLHWVTPRIRRDTAGGLGLRTFANASLYYAVRGRILLFSPSRDALVEALTLQPANMLTEEAFAEAFARTEGENVAGAVTFSPDDPFGGAFADFRFRLWLDKTQARVRCNATLREEEHERLAPLLEGVTPKRLTAPPPGLVAVSADLGKPLRDVWLALGKVLVAEDEESLFSEAKLADWESWPEETAPEVAHLAAAVLGPLGPGWRVALHDVDLEEWFPVPVLYGTFDVADGAAFIEDLPRAPEQALPWEPYPRYDAEWEMLRIPMIAGPSLEPAVAVYGDGLLVSTSSQSATEMLGKPPVLRPLEQPGNLYVRVQPADSVRTIEETLTFLVRENILQEQALEDYQAFFGNWIYSAQRVSEAAGLLGYENGEFQADLVVICSLLN